jgi:hypothetical protein
MLLNEKGTKENIRTKLVQYMHQIDHLPIDHTVVDPGRWIREEPLLSTNNEEEWPL